MAPSHDNSLISPTMSRAGAASSLTRHLVRTVGPLVVSYGVFYLVRPVSWQRVIIIFVQGGMDVGISVVRSLVRHGFGMAWDTVTEPRVQQIITNATREISLAAMATPSFLTWVASHGIRSSINVAASAWYFHATRPRYIYFLLFDDPNELNGDDRSGTPASDQGQTDRYPHNPGRTDQGNASREQARVAELRQLTMEVQTDHPIEEAECEMEEVGHEMKDTEYATEGTAYETEGTGYETEGTGYETEGTEYGVEGAGNEMGHTQGAVTVSMARTGDAIARNDLLGSEVWEGADGALWYRCTGITSQGQPCQRWSKSGSGDPLVWQCCRRHQRQWASRCVVPVEEEA